MSFSLRIDVVGWGFYDQVEKFLARYDSYLVVEEEASNRHVHCWFISSDTPKAVRCRFVKLFPEHDGNKGMYSLTQCDEKYERYLQYMCKGTEFNDGPVVKFRQGLLFTDDWVYDMHAAYWQENGTLQATRKLRDDQKLKGNMVEQVLAVARKQGLGGNRIDRVDIGKIYIRLMVEMKKPISVYAAKAVVNGVCAALSDQSIDCLAAEIAEY